MRTIFAEYNPQRNSIDVYTSAGYMHRQYSTAACGCYQLHIWIRR